MYSMVVNMKKNIYLFLILFFITGCSSDYELKVNPTSMEESVNFTLKDNDYDKAIDECDIVLKNNQ